MTKAKLILSGVALFAVVGGALAFKANRTEHTFFSTGAGGFCTVEFETTLTTDLNVPGPTLTRTISPVALPSAPCTTILVKTVI